MQMSSKDNFDLLTCLIESGLELIAHQILELLDVVDLRNCQLVSTDWNVIVERLYEHHEWNKVGRGWSQGQPSISGLQCLRERSVCTVTSLALDEESLVCALGTSGNIELWNRRNLQKDLSTEVEWRSFAHKDGVYSVDMNKDIVVSGGDDSTVKIWNRRDGVLLRTLEHHDYVVWNVRLWVDTLMTFSYDCTVATMKIKFQDEELTIGNVLKISGPVEWSEALASDKRGRFLVTHNEENFNLTVWNLSESGKSVTLSGHEDEVHCAKFLLPYLATGGSDKTVRIWKLFLSEKDSILGSECVRILTGHEGKVWSLDLDRHRIVAGGRYGEIRIWSLSDVIDPSKSDEDCSGRSLWCHPRSTAIGQICMERALLVTSDGLGTVKFLDFWKLDKTGNGCGCSKEE